jgi:hypothetical protein
MVVMGLSVFLLIIMILFAAVIIGAWAIFTYEENRCHHYWHRIRTQYDPETDICIETLHCSRCGKTIHRRS